MVLDRFTDLYYNSNFNEIKIIALDSEFNELEALDHGGPSRQFMTDLFEGLKEKSRKFKRTKTGFLMPHGDSPMTKREENLYENIGKLMGLCLTSGGKLLTGQIFDPALFKVMEATTSNHLLRALEDLPKEYVIFLLRVMKEMEMKSTFEFYDVTKWNCSDERLKRMFEFVSLMGYEIPSLQGKPSVNELRANFDLIQNIVKDFLYDIASTDSTLPRIFKICQGIAQHCTSSASQPWGKDPTEISNNIQGQFSKDIVKDVLACRPTSEGYEFNSKTRDYFFKWISESSTEKVQKFLKVATGSNTISKTVGINLNVGNMPIDNLPIYHTCQQQIDIPEYGEYETFKQKLEQSFGCLDDGAFQEK